MLREFSSASAKLTHYVHRLMLRQPATATLFCALSRKYQPDLQQARLQIEGFNPPLFCFGPTVSEEDLTQALYTWVQAEWAEKEHLPLRKTGNSTHNSPSRKISGERTEVTNNRISWRISCTPAGLAWQLRYLRRALQQWLSQATEVERQSSPGAAIEQSVLQQLTTGSRISWENLLRKQLLRTRRTRLAAHRQRPSRRYGSLPGTRIRPQQHLALAIDTSGSVPPDLLGRFAAEINALRRLKHRITLLQFDDRIRLITQLRGPLPSQWKGRGNTCYDPVIRWANRHRPDLLLIFTDGRGPRPLLTATQPLLWAVTAAPLPHFRPWQGQFIHLSAHN